MLDIALKNIWARKVRSILTILGIAGIINLVILISAIVYWITKDMNNQMAKYLGKMYVQASSVSGQVGREFPPISTSLNEDTARKILKETKNIKKKESSSLLYVPLAPPPYPNAPPEVLAAGIDVGKEKGILEGLNVKVERGRSTFSGDSAKEVIVGNWAVPFFEKRKGGNYKLRMVDKISIAGDEFKVVGILAESDTSFFNSIVFMPLRQAQETFNRKGTVSNVLVTADEVGNVDEVAQVIKKNFPKLEVVTQKEIAKNIEKTLEGMNMFMEMIINTVAVVAIIIILIVMFMSVMERTKEIGTLRAIGTKKRTVLWLIILETLILSILGGIAGVPIAYLIAKYQFEGLPLALPTILRVLGLVVVIGVLSGLYPAWRAARIDPLEALRYE